MKFGISDTQRAVVLAFSLFAMGPLLLPSMAQAQAQFVVTPMVEKKIEQLPAGTLYWQLENFPTLAEAQAAAGPTAMAAEVEGKVWLFTLGPQGSSTHGGNKVVEPGRWLSVHSKRLTDHTRLRRQLSGISGQLNRLLWRGFRDQVVE